MSSSNALTITSRKAFLLVVIAQFLHSCEEYIFRLYDRLLPAQLISDWISSNRAEGFLIANVLLVAFGFWCWASLLRRSSYLARGIAWGWAIVETANGANHILLAIGARDYFPGLATAPLLIVTAIWLIVTLRKSDAANAN